jgi:hypothetical protein
LGSLENIGLNVLKFPSLFGNDNTGTFKIVEFGLPIASSLLFLYCAEQTKEKTTENTTKNKAFII